jgi:YNFM family putative membrane transporter
MMTARRSANNILGVTLAAFCSMTAMRLADPLLPAISDEFGILTGEAAQIASAFAIAYGISQFVFGPLSDRFGKLTTLGWAVLLSVLANCAVGLSQEFNTIVFWRAIAGATTAGVVPLAMAWIGETVSYTDRQTTLARFLYGVLGGVIGGQIIGGVCADLGNWRAGFFLTAALYFVCWLQLRASGQLKVSFEQPHPVQHLGALKHFRNVFATPWSRFILLVVGIEGCFLYGALVFIPSYLHLERHFSLTEAGLLMAGFGLGGLLYASTAGRLLKRLGEAGLVRSGGLLLGVAFLMLLVPGFWIIPAIAVFAIGLGLYMLHNTLQTQATQMTPASRGTAVSLFACSLFFGQSIGIVAAGWTVDQFGFTPLFWTAAVALIFLSIWIASALHQYRDA